MIRAGGGSAPDTLSVLDQLIGGAPGDEGVTYGVDRDPVARALRDLTERGEYPSPVWGGQG